MNDAGWLAQSCRLARALTWRIRREGVRYLLVAFAPFVIILTLTACLPLLPGGVHAINGAQADTVLGLRYGARADAVIIGLLLTLTPGLVALSTAIGVGKAIRGMVGEQVSRGGLEELLGAPYSAAGIATALLACALFIGTAFWAIMSGLGAVTIACFAAVAGDHLKLSSGYLLLALALPLLTSWAGAGLALLVSLLFPRMTQLGTGVNLAGGNLGSGVAVLPGMAALLALLLGSGSIGSLGFFVAAGGAAAAIVVLSVGLVAYRFRAENVLGS